MSGLVDRISAVLRDEHRWITDGDVLISCSCGELSFTGESWDVPRLPQWAAHVAERIAAELNLTEEWGVMGPRDTEPYPVFDFRASAEKTAAARHQLQIEAAVVSRLVSGWIAVKDRP